MVNLDLDVVLSWESHTIKYGSGLIKSSSGFCWWVHWGWNSALTVKLTVRAVFGEVAAPLKKKIKDKLGETDIAFNFEICAWRLVCLCSGLGDTGTQISVQAADLHVLVRQSTTLFWGWWCMVLYSSSRWDSLLSRRFLYCRCCEILSSELLQWEAACAAGPAGAQQKPRPGLGTTVLHCSMLACDLVWNRFSIFCNLYVIVNWWFFHLVGKPAEFRLSPTYPFGCQWAFGVCWFADTLLLIPELC